MEYAEKTRRVKSAARPRTVNNSFWTRGGRLDYQSAFLVIVLSLIGVMMVFSSSQYKAATSGVESTYFMKKQLLFCIIGIVAMVLVSYVNYRYYHQFANILIVITMALTAVVLIIGKASHGATRWIQIGSLQFQPSEIAKPAIVIFMAHACCTRRKWLNSYPGLLKMTWPALLAVGLIATENLSTAIVCFCIMFAILFIASPDIKRLVIPAIIGVSGAAIFVMTRGYRGNRIAAWLHPEEHVDDAYQTLQSLYAIGSGGLFGKGLGQSVQKMGFLPEAHNDMIFSVICEELGLFGGIGIILIFVFLLLRFRYIANNAPDDFGGLLVSGVITHIAVQLLVNIGVVTNTIPNTGVTLPFISYGGTSLVFLFVEIGMVLGVSRQMRVE